MVRAELRSATPVIALMAWDRTVGRDGHLGSTINLLKLKNLDRGLRESQKLRPAPVPTLP